MLYSNNHTLSFKSDLEKNHNEVIQKRIRNKKHSSKIIDLAIKLKNEILTSVSEKGIFNDNKLFYFI